MSATRQARRSMRRISNIRETMSERIVELALPEFAFLEGSGTDLATEFSNMIIYQRGYQANTRIISVTDSMLEELVNIKR